MLYKSYLIIISSLLLISCLSTKIQSVKIKEKQYVVISDKENLEWYFGKKMEMFDISSNQLENVEIILRKIINSEKLRPFENYKFQYVCIGLDAKIIFIQAICNDSNFLESKDDKGNLLWEKELSIIADGGNCYWAVKINLNDKSYFDLNINTSS